MNKNKFFLRKIFLLLYFIFSFCIFFSQKINVYDTLLSHHLFTHIETEKKTDYFLDKDGNLKRIVFLSSETKHYHKSHEDSIYYFLKKSFGDKFKSLVFIAGENIKWSLDAEKKFSWKKGQIIKKEELDKIYSSISEMDYHPKRPEFVREEENNHFFFYHNYLLDSSKKIIYCFNGLNEKYRGKIEYNKEAVIISDCGFYPNGKTFYNMSDRELVIFSIEGKKIFLSNATRVYLFGNKGEGQVEIDKIISKNQDLKNYYKELNYLWKNVME
ncbi:MAG: hypothetical protein ACK5D5_06750 [Bacteroidota bacterium]|jgi:hypothetical protein